MTKKRPRGIGAKAGKGGAKQVRVEFTEERKEGGGAKPNRKKGGKVRRPIPTVGGRKRRVQID
jgi:hypothetical protein